MALLGYLPIQYYRGLGLAFAAHFLDDFSKKCSLSDTPFMYKVSISYLFSFSGYQTKCVIEFLFRQLMTSWIWFIFDHPPKQWPTGRKRGKERIQKTEYLEKEKSFLDEIKSMFYSFWRAIIWWKNKNLVKIADTCFKLNPYCFDFFNLK